MASELTYEQILNLFKESREEFKEIRQQSKEYAEERAIRSKEIDDKFKELAEEHKKTELAQQKTDEMIKKLGKQIGDLHNKFGEFNEHLFFNSLNKMMKKNFNIQFFQTNVYRNITGVGGMEIDALGIINGNVNALYLTEIKTKYSEKAISQLQKNIDRFNSFYPELADKKKYGLIAVPYLTDDEKEKILENGFYPVSIVGDIAELNAPENFVPKEFH